MIDMWRSERKATYRRALAGPRCWARWPPARRTSSTGGVDATAFLIAAVRGGAVSPEGQVFDQLAHHLPNMAVDVIDFTSRLRAARTGVAAHSSLHVAPTRTGSEPVPRGFSGQGYAVWRVAGGPLGSATQERRSAKVAVRSSVLVHVTPPRASGASASLGGNGTQGLGWSPWSSPSSLAARRAHGDATWFDAGGAR